jgi:hypothetical protein
VGTSVRRVRRLRTSPQSLVVAESLARRPCDLRTWFSGPSRAYSLSVQTPSSVDPTMNLQSQRFFSVFPLSSRCYFQPWFGSCIPARPSMKSPDFDFPLHLLLNRRRFCRHPSATASSTEAVDVVSALGRHPHLLPDSRSRFRLLSALPSPL